AEATNASLIEVKEMIFALGSLYETGYDRTETDEKMDLLIDEVLRKFYCEDDYDVTPLMKRLSPSCTEGIQSCYFRNKLVNCSDLFKFRKNQHGYCCTKFLTVCIFNYVREPDEITTDKEFKKHKPLRPLKIGNSGINNGLSIVREPELDDYFFTFFEMIGWKRNGMKWWSVLPHKVTNPEEVENFERAVEGDGDNLLHCNSCYPACNDVSYNVYTDFVPLQTGYYQSELLDNLEVKDQSIVHIYFINFGSVRLKMDLGYYWYELLSNIGGICGIFIGFSLLSLVELGYFFLGFIYEICCPGKIITEVENTIEDPRDPGDTVRSATDMQSVNRIYWNALLSQPR
ncbi:GSCOCG00000250001-RA-CDS, partial [Cotesia congregata]